MTKEMRQNDIEAAVLVVKVTNELYKMNIEGLMLLKEEIQSRSLTAKMKLTMIQDIDTRIEFSLSLINEGDDFLKALKVVQIIRS